MSDSVLQSDRLNIIEITIKGVWLFKPSFLSAPQSEEKKFLMYRKL